MKESDLSSPIKKYYESTGYEVFSEVTAKNSNKRADMILIKDDIRVCIELKTKLSFELLEQAKYWKKYSNFIYIGVPITKKERTPIIYEILNIYGIGLIEIDLDKFKNNENGLNVIPAKYRVMNQEEKDNVLLYEEHKTWLDGGSSEGIYVTNYRLVMKVIYTLLRSNIKENEEDWFSYDEIYEYILSNKNDYIKNSYNKDEIKKFLLTIENTDIMSLDYKNKLHFKVMEESIKYE